MTRPLLDWSDPHKTPRLPSSPDVAARQGGGVSPATPRPLTGSLAHYDALAEAVARYRSTWGRPAYEAMRDAATRCGMPQGEPPLSWSVRRLATYQHMMEQA
jgi:hypothetical protein